MLSMCLDNLITWFVIIYDVNKSHYSDDTQKVKKYLNYNVCGFTIQCNLRQVIR